MEAIARGKNLRGSARKARLVLDLIRGKSVNDAKNILVFSNKGVACKVGKILDSAIANLTEKEVKANLSNYIVSKAFADDGPIMRRYMPRAQGRATIIRKRTCHITLALSASKKGIETHSNPIADNKLKNSPSRKKVTSSKGSVERDSTNVVEKSPVQEKE